MEGASLYVSNDGLVCKTRAISSPNAFSIIYCNKYENKQGCKQ